MNLEKNLAKRTWPVKPGYAAERYSSGVSEGTLINRALRLFQSVSEPIPAGECAITSLCCGENGKIYGATSGKRSHLFFYDPFAGVCDVCVPEGAGSIRNALVAGKDGMIFGGISEGTEGYLFSYDSRSDRMRDTHMIDYGVSSNDRIERLTVPVRKETIGCMVIDKERDILYGISRASGTLFAYNIAKRSVSIKGTIDKNGLFSETLVMTPNGKVYCCGGSGSLLEYNPDEDTLKELSVYLPTVAGRSFYNKLQAAVYNPYDGLIYASGSADGVLFAFNPADYSMRTIGKVTAEAGCPAVTAGNDGKIYGISGEPGGMAHLFCYDPETYSLADLGMPFATSEIYWHGYEFSCACTGINGEIYLGESDRISHLFIYFPRIPRKAPSNTRSIQD